MYTPNKTPLYTLGDTRPNGALIIYLFGSPEAGGYTPSDFPEAELSHFTIRYQGTLTVTLDLDGNLLWYFNGQMDFYDKWNFDTSSHRHETAEAKVRLANAFLPGKAFEITSVRVNVQQGNVPGSFVDLENGVQQAIWSGGTPTPVPDRCSRLAKLVGYDF